VVSLLFVAYTIEQNTAVMQSSNDNWLYDLADRQDSAVSQDRNLATLTFKYYSGEELSGVDRLQYDFHMQRTINAWELAFDRHKEDLLSDENWYAWNRAYSVNIKNGYPEEWWASSRIFYGDEFAEHVDSIYEND